MVRCQLPNSEPEDAIVDGGRACLNGVLLAAVILGTIVLCSLCCRAASAQKWKGIYEGVWSTETGKKMARQPIKLVCEWDGRQWSGTFSGHWSYGGGGGDFSYRATWTYSEAAQGLTVGKTQVDGKIYEWSGVFADRGSKFTINFLDGGTWEKPQFYRGTISLVLKSCDGGG